MIERYNREYTGKELETVSALCCQQLVHARGQGVDSSNCSPLCIFLIQLSITACSVLLRNAHIDMKPVTALLRMLYGFHVMLWTKTNLHENSVLVATCVTICVYQRLSVFSEQPNPSDSLSMECHRSPSFDPHAILHMKLEGILQNSSLVAVDLECPWQLEDSLHLVHITSTNLHITIRWTKSISMQQKSLHFHQHVPGISCIYTDIHTLHTVPRTTSNNRCTK